MGAEDKDEKQPLLDKLRDVKRGEEIAQLLPSFCPPNSCQPACPMAKPRQNSGDKGASKMQLVGVRPLLKGIEQGKKEV